MADTKISALTAITGANVAPDDVIPIVDTSTATTKSITREELQTYNAGTLTTDKKVLDLSVTWNNTGVTFGGLKFNVTDTASAAGSLLMDLQVGGVSKTTLSKVGRLSISNSASSSNIFEAYGDTTLYWYVNSWAEMWLSSAGVGFKIGATPSVGDAVWIEQSGNVRLKGYIGLGATANGVIDITLNRDAAAILAQRDGTNAQTFRLYNTYTDASNYERLAIGWAANVVSIKPENAGTGSARVLHISGLPTSNPGPGILWNNAGTPAIGT